MQRARQQKTVNAYFDALTACIAANRCHQIRACSPPFARLVTHSSSRV